MLVYLFVIFTIAFFYKTGENVKERKFHLAVFMSLLFVVSLYQYYYLLNRLRSYFVPFIIVYVYDLLQHGEKRKGMQIFSSLFVCLMYVFCLNSIYERYKDQNCLKSGIYDTCTIFDLLKYDEATIKERQLKKSEYYWNKEFMSFDTNKLDEK